MMRKAWLLLFVACVALASPAAAVDRDDLLIFTGFDYETSSNPGLQFLDNVGMGYNAVGFASSINPIVPSNEAANEYTFYLYDAVVNSTFFSDGFLLVYFNAGARFRVYEDPFLGGTAANYGINPPNATAPASFIDGTVLLGAAVDGLVLTYDYNTLQGTLDANATLDEGAALASIPPARRGGWLLSGTAGAPNPSIPEGYEHQLAGKVQIPYATSSSPRSWGQIKALYR